MGSSKANFVYGSQSSIYLGKSEKRLFLARLWQKELSAERKLPYIKTGFEWVFEWVSTIIYILLGVTSNIVFAHSETKV